MKKNILLTLLTLFLCSQNLWANEDEPLHLDSEFKLGKESSTGERNLDQLVYEIKLHFGSDIRIFDFPVDITLLGKKQTLGYRITENDEQALLLDFDILSLMIDGSALIEKGEVIVKFFELGYKKGESPLTSINGLSLDFLKFNFVKKTGFGLGVCGEFTVMGWNYALGDNHHRFVESSVDELSTFAKTRVCLSQTLGDWKFDVNLTYQYLMADRENLDQFGEIRVGMHVWGAEMGVSRALSQSCALRLGVQGQKEETYKDFSRNDSNATYMSLGLYCQGL